MAKPTPPKPSRVERPRTRQERNALVESRLPPKSSRRRRRSSMDWTPEETAHKRYRKEIRRRVRKNIPVENRVCQAPLLSGRPCRCAKYVLILEIKGKERYFLAPTCYAHLTNAQREKYSKSKYAPMKPGERTPRPKIGDLMAQQIEQEVADFLQPYFEALTAMKQVVVGNGPHARMVEVDDHRTRMMATEALFDRAYGKPKQTQELSGGVTVQPVEVPQDKQRQLAVAQILAESGAIGTIAGAGNPASRN